MTERSLSAISSPGATPLPTAPVPRVKLPGFQARPGCAVGRSGRSSEATAPRATAGHTRGRRQGPERATGLENTRVRPGAICSRQPQPQGTTAVGRHAPSCQSGHTRTTHGRRLCRGGHAGAAECAVLSCRLRSLPGALQPARPAVQEPRGGAPSPVPGSGWRCAQQPGMGLRAPPAGNPSGQPRGEGPGPRCAVRRVTSRALVKPSRRPYQLCRARALRPWARQLTAPSLVCKSI